jgi:hypothetical protein
MELLNKGLKYNLQHKPKKLVTNTCNAGRNGNKTQRYWVFELCPSSGFSLNNNEKTQRFGNWICFRPQVREDTYSVGSLRIKQLPIKEQNYMCQLVANNLQKLLNTKK